MTPTEPLHDQDQAYDAVEENAPKGLAVMRIERVLSRTVAAVGLTALALAVFLNPGQGLSPVWPLALVGALASAKLVVLVLGVRAGWEAWPAVLAEIVALGLVGYLVSARAQNVPLIVVVACLLGGALLLRRRALARMAE